MSRQSIPATGAATRAHLLAKLNIKRAGQPATMEKSQ